MQKLWDGDGTLAPDRLFAGRLSAVACCAWTQVEAEEEARKSAPEYEKLSAQEKYEDERAAKKEKDAALVQTRLRQGMMRNATVRPDRRSVQTPTRMFQVSVKGGDPEEMPASLPGMIPLDYSTERSELLLADDRAMYSSNQASFPNGRNLCPGTETKPSLGSGRRAGPSNRRGL